VFAVWLPHKGRSSNTSFPLERLEENINFLKLKKVYWNVVSALLENQVGEADGHCSF
jgi:hypothetical protein